MIFWATVIPPLRMLGDNTCVFVLGKHPESFRVVAGSPAGNIFARAIRFDVNSPSQQAAETGRLAACAPQRFCFS